MRYSDQSGVSLKQQEANVDTLFSDYKKSRNMYGLGDEREEGMWNAYLAASRRLQERKEAENEGS